MRINQAGNEIEETQLFTLWGDTPTNEQRDAAIALILKHMQLECFETNSTKHGNTEIELRERT